MAYFDTPQPTEPKGLPNYLVGAASPLWAYFGIAAAGGVAFWWMTRWTRPTNLEAMFAAAAPVADTVVEPVLEAAEAVAELPPVALELVAEAKSEPVMEPVPAPALEAAPEPLAEAVPEPLVEAAPEAAEESHAWAEPPATMDLEPAAAPELAPKPRAKKVAPPEA